MTRSRSTISLLAAAFAAGTLFLAPAAGALAHGHNGGWNGSGGSNHGDDFHQTISGNHHHHHHHGSGPFGTGPVHGPGSSHNPIVYHPKHGPGSSHNPIITPVTVVRDHRRPPPRPNRQAYRDRMCRLGHLSYCSPDHVRDHRTPPGTQCLGNLC